MFQCKEVAKVASGMFATKTLITGHPANWDSNFGVIQISVFDVDQMVLNLET